MKFQNYKPITNMLHITPINEISVSPKPKNVITYDDEPVYFQYYEGFMSMRPLVSLFNTLSVKHKWQHRTMKEVLSNKENLDIIFNHLPMMLTENGITKEVYEYTVSRVGAQNAFLLMGLAEKDEKGMVYYDPNLAYLLTTFLFKEDDPMDLAVLFYQQ